MPKHRKKEKKNEKPTRHIVKEVFTQELIRFLVRSSDLPDRISHCVLDLYQWIMDQAALMVVAVGDVSSFVQVEELSHLSVGAMMIAVVMAFMVGR